MTYVILALVAIAAFLLWVSRKPDEFSIQRQISINVPASDIFTWINNVRRFNLWNPWAAMDPDTTMTYNGTDEGPGASYSWVGKKTGQGTMTLLDQSPPTDVNFSLDFVKPFKANNKANFHLIESAGPTIVVWTMTGKNGFTNKLFQTFVNMDNMVGKDFEKGLANLKTKVEQKKVNR
jgi:hypothetical protein